MTYWTIPAIALAGALAISVSGCGDIAYKTGAGADQLRQDKEACKTSGDESRCLKDKGWAMSSLEPGASPPPIAETPQTSSASAPVAAPSVPPQTDPLRMVAISGWAKFGAGSPDEAIAECVATLGPAHRPDAATHRVSAALLACMRAKNWLAL
jgi:hypothetical protein